MKLRLSRSAKHFHRGLSLIELMVSLVIGLVLMIAVVSAYVGSAGATRMVEAQGRMNEDAQAALTILAQQLRMAGTNPKQPNYTSASPRNPVYGPNTFIVRGCDGRFSDVTTATTIPALTCGSGTTTFDSIALSYEADSFNTIAGGGGSATDCLGQALPVSSATVNVWNGTSSSPTAVTFTVADNRFYVGTTTTIVTPSLFCKGNGGSNPQALVENIEDLQFVYGTAPATATPTTVTVAGYLTATGIQDNAGLAALPTDAARWAQVMTVRICVVVRSERPVVSDAGSAEYIQCDGTLNTTPPDLRVRRAYTTTVVLRNRVPS